MQLREQDLQGTSGCRHHSTEHQAAMQAHSHSASAESRSRKAQCTLSLLTCHRCAPRCHTAAQYWSSWRRLHMCRTVQRQLFDHRHCGTCRA